MYYLALNSITNPLLPLLFLFWVILKQFNGLVLTIPFDESLLPIIARRGDAEDFFMKFLEFYHEEDYFEEEEEHLKESLAEAAKYGQLKILQKATSKNVLTKRFQEKNLIWKIFLKNYSHQLRLADKLVY